MPREAALDCQVHWQPAPASLNGRRAGAGVETMSSRLTIRTMAPAGASQDLLARLLSSILRARFGCDAAVENAPGQDGQVAARLTRSEPADGRHLLLTGSATLTFYPALGGAGYEESDFEPLLGVGRYNFVVVTASTQPWKTLNEVFDAVRGAGRTLRYAGSGQTDFLLVRAMAAAVGLGVEFLQLNGPALLEAVLGGEADIGLGTGTHQLLLEEGRLRVVARLHPRDQPGAGTPDPHDFGVDAALNMFVLISTPKGAPAAAKTQLIARLAEAAETPETRELLVRRLAMLPDVLRGAELTAAIEEQKRDFARLQPAAVVP